MKKPFNQKGVVAFFVLIGIVIVGLLVVGFWILRAEVPIDTQKITQRLDSRSKEVIEVEWVENVMVQPVPEHASKIRLSLPVEVDELLLETNNTFQGFGTHINDRTEGVEVASFTIKDSTKIRSMADGKVTGVYPGDNYLGCQVQIDYGGGLHGRHHYLKECLVKVGQIIRKGGNLGEGNSFQGAAGFEFLLADENRSDGTKSEFLPTGRAVSMYDYLEKSDLEVFINIYMEKYIEPYIAKGQNAGSSVFLWEPFLTNPILVHTGNPGKLTGEWIATNKWVRDGKPDIISFLDVDHIYWTGRYMRGHDFMDWQNLIAGEWEADYQKGQVKISGELGDFFGIFEIDESEELAKLKFEYQKDSYPNKFSSKARTFVEHQPTTVYEQGEEMNVIQY
jgi:hypothetical protein